MALALQKELQQRVARAGVMIEETRLTHLAYAPEIAGVMLRRQQAEAIIDARQKIVHGAVSMVQMALTDLASQQGPRAGRGAQGHHGEQSAGRAVRRARGPTGDQRRHAVHLGGPSDETAKTVPAAHQPRLYEALEAWAQQEFRSVNAHIEFLLIEALRKQGRRLKTDTEQPPPERSA